MVNMIISFPVAVGNTKTLKHRFLHVSKLESADDQSSYVCMGLLLIHSCMKRSLDCKTQKANIIFVI